MGKTQAIILFGIIFLIFQTQAAAFEQHVIVLIPDTGTVLPKTNSEHEKDTDEQITWYRMFTNIPADYAGLFYSTFKVQRIPVLLTVGAATGLLMLADEPGWKYDHTLIKKYQSFGRLSDYSIKMGDGKYQFLTAGLFAVPGLIFHNETAIRTGSNIAEAIISTGLMVQLLKRITGRESPSAATVNGGDWDPFPSVKQYQQNQPAYYSFPSGHLSTATAILTVIANNYPDEKWIKPAGYPLLGLLGVSLVSKGMHWYSDLPLAYFLGYSFGNIIAPERKAQDQRKSSLLVAPSINYDGAQLGVIYNF